MPHPGSANFHMADGSVHMLHGTHPVTLASLAQGLRRRGPSASATTWGTPVPALQTVIAALRRHGVALGALAVRPAQGPLPVLMVIADQRDVMSGPGAAVVFLVADDGPTTPLLLPAVQAAREAARRATCNGEVELVLVQRTHGSSQAQPHESLSLNFQKLVID